MSNGSSQSDADDGVGVGLGGALLAWRLTACPGVAVEIFPGDPAATSTAATTTSGGLVRAYDPDASQCRAAAESLAELRGSPALRRRAGYREAGSLHLLAPGTDPTARVRVIDELLPGSVEVLDRDELARRYRFRDLEPGAVGVAERHAGWCSPARLRARTLDGIARRCAGAPVPGPGGGTRPDLAPREGTTIASDIVVLATGSYTPTLLARSGLPTTALRIKQIQYIVHDVDLGDLAAFVDDNSGLYGRPAGPGGSCSASRATGGTSIRRCRVATTSWPPPSSAAPNDVWGSGSSAPDRRSRPRTATTIPPDWHSATHRWGRRSTRSPAAAAVRPRVHWPRARPRRQS